MTLLLYTWTSALIIFHHPGIKRNIVQLCTKVTLPYFFSPSVLPCHRSQDSQWREQLLHQALSYNTIIIIIVAIIVITIMINVDTTITIAFLPR